MDTQAKIEFSTAKAKAEARIIEANGEAQKMLILADAENQARRMQAELLENNPVYAKQRALKVTANALSQNSKVIFLNPDNRNFFSSLLAVQEVNKTAFSPIERNGQ